MRENDRACPRCGTGFGVDAFYCPADGAELVRRDPRVGSVVAGHITLGSVIGEGAAGRVYRGRQAGVERDVAVKVLHRALSCHPEVAKRFEREAHIASRLQHPHVVEVYMAGRLDDGALYIVMEYLDGAPLDVSAPVDLARALAITLQICDAVGEAHARGFVHRDLKPENVVLVSRAETRDWVKVLDFGIATTATGLATSAGRVFGTPRYISPEAARGEAVTPASDVYAIATMLYQMLSGHTPFDAEDGLTLLIQQIYEEPPELAGVPEAVARVVMDNLAKDPARRAPDAHAFAKALLAASAPSPVVEDTLAGTSQRTSEVPRSRPRAFALAAVIAVLAAIGMTGAIEGVLHRGEAERSALASSAREALADGRFLDANGLVTSGLARWPGDPMLLQLRIDAAHDLLTQSMTARASGDVEAARDAAAKASELDPNDRTARSLAEQYDRELADTAPDGRTRVLFRATPPAPGRSITVAARVVTRTPSAIGAMKVASYDGDVKIEGVPTEVHDGIFEARIPVLGHGPRRVVFEAVVGGRPLRAERTVVVP